MDEADQSVLLAAARDAIAATLERRPPRTHPREDAPPFAEPRATFVTLRAAGALRGCIGELEARRALIASVRDCAVGAATRDPRFMPVAPDELAALRIGISVLSPPRPIRPEAVEVGRHGLWIERGRQRGVLLPEVATDQGWDREAFLRATCRKAGLAAEAWTEPDTALHAFETIKLSER